ncbi:hypothetical protein F7725_004663, partial [Dissostichus mawsoni]
MPSPSHGSAVSRRHHPSALVVWCACIFSFEVALAVCHQAWLKVQLLDPHGSGGPRLECRSTLSVKATNYGVIIIPYTLQQSMGLSR